MSDDVRVRMYNVGFGDCFLLEFPRHRATPFRLLVDCGAHTSGYPRQGWKPEHTVDQIIADVTGEDGQAVIDVVVGTHRHQDHVSGFRAQAWQHVTVGQVWMPWTEHPNDPEAVAILNRQSRLALGLQVAFAGPGFATRWTNPDAANSLRALVANSLTNEAAMRTLHRGFHGKPTRRFLAAPTAPIVPQGCEELTVHVLGPSKDPEVIRDMDPPAGQSYLRYASAAAATESTPNLAGPARGPFSRNFRITPAEYELEHVGPSLDPDIKKAAASMMRGDDFAAAVSLDKAVNGTSLMLMFEFRNAFLLFPGDAQWGTWNAALRHPETRELLARTTFYKVGHHGSHNATPVEFVDEVLTHDTPVWAAAASVRQISFWPEIPRQPLLEQLRTHADRVVRSDHPGRTRKGVYVRPKSTGVDFRVPC